MHSNWLMQFNVATYLHGFSIYILEIKSMHSEMCCKIQFFCIAKYHDVDEVVCRVVLEVGQYVFAYHLYWG